MKILTWITLLTTAESFSTPRLALCRRSTHLHGEGGTDWIKNAMGEEETPKDPEFTNQEIKEMENLIVTLSMESNDDKRREKLSGILEKELKSTKEKDSTLELNPEVPRFAKLFQISLDNVGERVQTAAREKAMQRQEAEVNSETDDTQDVVERVKSEEELQLWALIDIMVQSKTAVKLHMGSLGSKGSFR